MIILLFTIINAQNFSYQSQDQIPADWNRITIVHDNGTSETYTQNKFQKTELNDIIYAEVDLPDNPGDGNYSIFTNLYNMIVTVTFQDRVLFEYGADTWSKGRQIGNVFIVADIPEDAWGNTVTFELKNVDYSFAEALSKVEIHRSSGGKYYLLKGTRIPYLISVMFLIMSVLTIIPVLYFKNNGKLRSRGLILIFLSFSTILWTMGYQKMFFVTSDNSEIICNIEYAGIFLTPAAIALFISETETNKRIRIIMRVMLAVSLSILAVCTFLNFCTVSWHYCRTLFLVHIQIIVYFAAIIIHFSTDKCPDDFYVRNFRTGTLTFIAFAIIDMVIYFLNNKGYQSTSSSFVQVGLFAYLQILILSYIRYVVEFYITFKDQERLKKLAYTDGMTGVSNRRACLDFIEELNKSKNSYGLIFIDVNNLKLANDKYSHDVGDRLIIFIADSLKTAFGDDYFCGRYGGDEFIAGIESDSDPESDITERLEHFQELVRASNEKNEFPFKVSAACGYALSSENPDKNAEEILGLADQNMYLNKVAMKKQRC